MLLWTAVDRTRVDPGAPLGPDLESTEKTLNVWASAARKDLGMSLPLGPRPSSSCPGLGGASPRGRRDRRRNRPGLRRRRPFHDPSERPGPLRARAQRSP